MHVHVPTCKQIDTHAQLKINKYQEVLKEEQARVRCFCRHMDVQLGTVLSPVEISRGFSVIAGTMNVWTENFSVSLTHCICDIQAHFKYSASK